MFAEQIKLEQSNEDYAREVLTNLQTKEVKITADTYAVQQAMNQIKSLHEGDDGFIAVALKKDKQWIQYHYKENHLVDNIDKVLSIEDFNIYVTPNSFYKPFRRIENVRKLNALYIDVDYYNIDSLKDYKAEEIIYLLDKKYFKKKIPEASFIVITGRGIAVYWLIQPVPYMVMPLWRAVQKFLLEELKDIGGDPKSIDSPRVMRVAGSINQKNGQAAELLAYDTNYRYSLRDIQEKYLPKLTPYVKNPAVKKRGRKPKMVKLYSIYNLHFSRLMDIVQLQQLREGMCRNEEGKLIETGQRELMCFLYRYWCCCFNQDTEKALKDTLEFNKGFALPLVENEVKSQTRAAERAYEEWKLNDFNIKRKKEGSDELIIDEELKKKANKLHNSSDRKGYKFLGYNYTNKTLIKLLCITEEEMRELKTIIGKEEVKRRTNIRTNEIHKSKRRNEEGLTKREQAKLEKIKVIKELKEKGLSYSKIAKELNISINTVKKYSSKYIK